MIINYRCELMVISNFLRYSEYGGYHYIYLPHCLIVVFRTLDVFLAFRYTFQLVSAICKRNR